MGRAATSSVLKRGTLMGLMLVEGTTMKVRRFRRTEAAALTARVRGDRKAAADYRRALAARAARERRLLLAEQARAAQLRADAQRIREAAAGSAATGDVQ